MQTPARKPHAPTSACGTYRRAFVLSLVFAVGACDSNGAERRSAEPTAQDNSKASSHAPAASASATPSYRAYGAPLVPGDAAQLVSVAENPQRWSNRTVTVEGDVRRACTRKGCWMEIVDPAAPETTRCRVTFKDYAFFVPTTSAGAKARVQGEAKVTQVSADHVQHLESEGAQFPRKQPDGSAEELNIVATGVELLQAS